MESKILVIDDDSIILFIHRTMLKNSGIETPREFFESAELALEYINQHQDDYQFLLLLDINMPIMNGWELLDVLQNFSFKENIKVVMVTSSINESDRAKAKTYDIVVAYVAKPLKVADLTALQTHHAISHFFGSEG